MQDLDSDVIRQFLILAPSKFSIRCVSTKLKAAMEQMPGLVIVLSEEGAQNATVDFFLKFREPIILLKRYCKECSQGISSLCSAIRLGLVLRRVVLPTDTDDNLALEMAFGFNKSLAEHRANIRELEFGFTSQSVSVRKVIESVRQLSECSLVKVHVAVLCTVPVPRYPMENEMGYTISSMQCLDGFAAVISLRLRY